MITRTKRHIVLVSPIKGKITATEFERMSKLYDELCEKADLILKKYNPCKVEKKGECLRGYFCCDFCEFLSKKKGCKEKSLACKLWLCDKARKNFPACASQLDELQKIAEEDPLIPIGGKSIKEDIFLHYELIDCDS